ncbi:MAG: transaldolase [Ardenticatenia bacterium]|nr:MAG: transaldolase [Ardenticatenia bacterium]
MSANPLKELLQYGQSVWYDNIHRGLLRSGELQRLVDEGVRGVTSNPTIFKNAISQGEEYRADIIALSQAGKSPLEIYEALAIADIAAAADVLRPVYEQSDGLDGYVSIEVNPLLAHDTQATIAEARRLFATLGRPNIMIKVPATMEGIPAIRALIGEGVNVNVTLLFAVEMYRRAAEAYIAGLEDAAAAGRPLQRIASVASFFVSRVDTLADRLLQAKIDAVQDEVERARLRTLQGKLAIANAKIAYREYKEIFGSARFQRLAEQGARPQRLLWASTSTKNPAYRDVIYVEELIGAPTVNTMPPQTIEAFKDHGRLRNSLEEDLAGAEATIRQFEEAGLSIRTITDQLLEEGVAAFSQSFNELLAAIRAQMQAVATPVSS